MCEITLILYQVYLGAHYPVEPGSGGPLIPWPTYGETAV